MSTWVKMGSCDLEMEGPYLTQLRESNELLDDIDALRNRMKEDGYLLIRNFHERNQVMAARDSVLAKLVEKDYLAPGSNVEDGVIGAQGKGLNLHGHDQPQALLDLVNSKKTLAFFDRFLGGESTTFDFKWLRAVDTGDSTGAHYDVVYMGRGTKNLYTLWTPLGDVSYEMGGLAILTESKHRETLQENYGKMDVDRDRVTGWFSTNPIELIEKYGGRWATTEFKAGDALIFGMFTMHAS